MRTKIKTRVKIRGDRVSTGFIPIRSPTLLWFLILGFGGGLAFIYFLLKYLAHMPMEGGPMG